MNKFIGLSGLPRTGSTLLSSILSQNPDIHAEGNSAVCQLMWDMQQSCTNSEQLEANYKEHIVKDLVSEIPKIYYKDVKSSIVFDKCRSWTMPANMAMLHTYLDHKPKVIVLIRPVVEIVKSFAYLWKINNRPLNTEDLLAEGTDYLMRSLYGVKWAKQNNNGEFLFITYDDLINKTKEVIDSIYDFCEIDHFNHDYNHIVNKHPEKDSVYELIGQHTVRSTISKRNIDFELPEELIARCNSLDV